MRKFSQKLIIKNHHHKFQTLFYHSSVPEHDIVFSGKLHRALLFVTRIKQFESIVNKHCKHDRKISREKTLSKTRETSKLQISVSASSKALLANRTTKPAANNEKVIMVCLLIIGGITLNCRRLYAHHKLVPLGYVKLLRDPNSSWLNLILREIGLSLGNKHRFREQRSKRSQTRTFERSRPFCRMYSEISVQIRNNFNGSLFGSIPCWDCVDFRLLLHY